MSEETIPVEENQPTKKKTPASRTFRAGVICLILGIVLMCVSVWTVIFYAPLFLVTFILSIVVMVQKRVMAGLMLLLAVLFIPPVILAASIAEPARAELEGRLGEPVETRHMAVVVRSAVQKHVSPGTVFAREAKPGMTFLVVEWGFVNTSDRPLNMFEFPDIYFLDSLNRKYSPVDSPLFGLDDINPGQGGKTTSVFELPLEVFEGDGAKILIDADQDVVLSP